MNEGVGGYCVFGGGFWYATAMVRTSPCLCAVSVCVCCGMINFSGFQGNALIYKSTKKHYTDSLHTYIVSLAVTQRVAEFRSITKLG